MLSQGPIEDRLQIRELIDSYNNAVMRFDGETWASNWAEDGVWHLPGAGDCILYTSPSPRDRQKSRMPSSA